MKQTHYTQGQAIEFIESCFGKGVLSNGGLNMSVRCPVCAEKEDNSQKKKLVIRTDDFLTHCWICSYRSTNLLQLLSKYHPNLVGTYKEKFGVKAKQVFKRCMIQNLEDLFIAPEPVSPPLVELPTGFTLLASNLGKGIKSVESAWRYLKGRKVTESELWLWKFGITDYRAPKGEQDYRFRVIVPSHDSQGSLNYFSARTYWSQGFRGNKYENPKVPRESIIFNELNIDWTQELTLVEGTFDLIKSNENSTCLLGSTLFQKHLLFQKIVQHNTPILLALDTDARDKSFKIAKLLTEYGIQVRLFQVPSEFKDVGQMTKNRFIEEQKYATIFSSEDLLRWKLDLI